MQKNIRVKVAHRYGTAGLLQSLPYSAIWQCNILTTFLWIGILTAPPRYRGFDLSTFWAWLRYASAVSEHHPDLRLKPIWSEIDAHQKTVMSDDFGMGFSCHYLAEQHGLQVFANTAYLLDLLPDVTALHPSKRGPAKSPDFIAVDDQGRLHVLECKGTQSSVKYLVSALESGIRQKNNFTNATPFASSMVGGIFVPQHSSHEDAVLMYIDPEPDPRLRALGNLSPDLIEQGIYRISLAKELMAAGLWRAASALERRERSNGSSGSREELLDEDLRFAGFQQGDSTWSRTMQYRSIEIDSLRFNSQEEVKELPRLTTLKIEVADEVTVFVREILKMDREGSQEEADRLIVARAKKRQRTHHVSSHWQASESSQPRTKVRRVVSAWEQKTMSETSAALTGPSGIRFELSRHDQV